MPVVCFQITLNNAEVSCEYIQTLKSNLEVLLLSSALYLHLVGIPSLTVLFYGCLRIEYFVGRMK